MKNLAILFLVSFFSINLFSQFFVQDSQGLEYFKMGSECINLGQYEMADSLLTLALCSFKDGNVYFNRSVSRLMQNDTIGFCHDISISANKYFDKQAEGLYDQYCCSKVDTVFYNKKRLLSNALDYRYYEVIKYPRYDSNAIGTYHDIKAKELVMSIDYGCNSKIMGGHSAHTDMIAAYVIEDGEKYYFKAHKTPTVFNNMEYLDLKERAQKLLLTKYSHIKERNQVETVKVYFQVYFDKKGNTVKVKYKGFFPELSFDSDVEALEKDLLDIADSYPKIIPAKFFKDKVRSIAYDSVEF